MKVDEHLTNNDKYIPLPNAFREYDRKKRKTKTVFKEKWNYQDPDTDNQNII